MRDERGERREERGEKREERGERKENINPDTTWRDPNDPVLFHLVNCNEKKESIILLSLSLLSKKM